MPKLNDFLEFVMPLIKTKPPKKVTITEDDNGVIWLNADGRVTAMSRETYEMYRLGKMPDIKGGLWRSKRS